VDWIVGQCKVSLERAGGFVELPRKIKKYAALVAFYVDANDRGAPSATPFACLTHTPTATQTSACDVAKRGNAALQNAQHLSANLNTP
jgi:hypothetical protein